MRIFTAVIEKCPDTGLFVDFIPGFPEAHTQAASLDEMTDKSYVGRNPKTGEQVKIKPKKLPFFKCGKELKNLVDNKK